MRGVYTSGLRRLLWTTGSSPHARGLLECVVTRFIKHGIIPACAGFTHIEYCPQTATEDHPRMRGVYFWLVISADVAIGSSPHARGLRGRGPCGLDRPGIIPACAGFTGTRARRRRRASDHPRMRGVYPVRNWTSI